MYDYQKALDDIPAAYKVNHKYYKWYPKFGGEAGEPMTWTKDHTRVPGTSEPYYVDGRSNGETSDWLRNLNPSLFGPPPLSWKLSKRAQENATKIYSKAKMDEPARDLEEGQQSEEP
ncbi:hypothetical protein Dda_6322 [Drechslerella dactyloides]|uniref:Uncharacterized protein n=1 Tax=Drechslerella dactyloides TaxID=74499 RepID=A0AAD6NIG1_DREDA|nr:hypothetical protein Dda_6322 [Drechslerella dactyloides]